MSYSVLSMTQGGKTTYRVRFPDGTLGPETRRRIDQTEAIAMMLFERDGLKHADGSSLEKSWLASPRYHEEYRARAANELKRGE